MRIQLISDLHLEGRNSIPTVKADMIIVAGDLHTTKAGLEDALNAFANAYKYVVYTPGNHEYYGSIKLGELKLAVKNNVFVLNPGTVFIDDISITAATLWTDFHDDGAVEFIAKRRINDFRFLTTKEVKQAYQRELEYIRTAPRQGKHIIVTHFIPDYALVHSKWKKHYETDIMSKYFSNQAFKTLCEDENFELPDYWLFGHTHDRINRELGGVKFMSAPVGYYGENRDYKPLILDI